MNIKARSSSQKRPTCRRAAGLLAVALGLLMLFFLASATRAAARPASGKPASELQRRLQRTLDGLRARDGFPGATAAAVLGDGKVIAVSTGFSDLEQQIGMKPCDRMLAGSIGKTYFAAVMMQMAHEGQLDLEAQIRKWIGDEPWFPRFPNADSATFRTLLNHTSGIPEHVISPTFIAALRSNPDKNWTPLELLSFTFDKPALFPPGSDWSYADTNFILAGYIMEKMTGRPLYDQVRTRILIPLKLTDTIPSISRTLPGLVSGYSRADSPFGFAGRTIQDGRFIINPQFEWTGGGFLSTSTDLARWAKALYEGKAVSKDILRVMEKGVLAKTGENDEYGLGVQIRHTIFGVTYGHGGWFPGYLSEMEYFPDQHVAIAVQVNTDKFPKAKGKTHSYILALAEELFGHERSSSNKTVSSTGLTQTLSPRVRVFVRVGSPVVALTYVRVIDGTGAAPREDQTVLLRGGKIQSVGAASSANVPKDAEVLDLPGYTVMPGLVGMHDHMFYPTGDDMSHEMAISFPRLYLASGVTTIRTAGTIEPYMDLGLSKQIDRGEVPGPHMHVTSPYMEGPGSRAPSVAQLNSPEEAAATVNFWIDRGVDNFKVYRFISRAVLKAVIDAAHKRGTKVTGHLCSIGFREAAELGIDELEHGLITDTEFFSGKKPDECPDWDAVLQELIKMHVTDASIQDMVRDLVAHHVAVTSTLPNFENFAPNRSPLQQRTLDALSPEAKTEYLENRVRAALLDKDPQTGKLRPEPWTQAFELEKQFERAFVQAGGLLLAGEDPTGTGGNLAGFGDQRSVELLVETGFTPLEAIHIATSNGAQYLGELDRVGTIQPGKQADLVVIKGNPSHKIDDIENVEIVFKNGIGYNSVQLIESVRGLEGSR